VTYKALGQGDWARINEMDEERKRANEMIEDENTDNDEKK
jgi:hypothetical protein